MDLPPSRIDELQDSGRSDIQDDSGFFGLKLTTFPTRDIEYLHSFVERVVIEPNLDLRRSAALAGSAAGLAFASK